MPSLSFEKTAPAIIIREAVEMFSSNISSVRFDISGVDQETEIYLDREKMKQVLINLLSNAIEAVDREGDIQVRTDLLNKENILY